MDENAVILLVPVFQDHWKGTIRTKPSAANDDAFEVVLAYDDGSSCVPIRLSQIGMTGWQIEADEDSMQDGLEDRIKMCWLGAGRPLNFLFKDKSREESRTQ